MNVFWLYSRKKRKLPNIALWAFGLNFLALFLSNTASCFFSVNRASSCNLYSKMRAMRRKKKNQYPVKENFVQAFGLNVQLSGTKTDQKYTVAVSRRGLDLKIISKAWCPVTSCDVRMWPSFRAISIIWWFNIIFSITNGRRFTICWAAVLISSADVSWSNGIRQVWRHAR